MFWRLLLFTCALACLGLGPFDEDAIDCPPAAGDVTFKVVLGGQSQCQGFSTEGERGGGWVNQTCCYRTVDNTHKRCVGYDLSIPETDALWDSYEACLEADCGIQSRQRFGLPAALSKILVERSGVKPYIVAGCISNTSMEYTLNVNGPRQKPIEDCIPADGVACGIAYQDGIIDAVAETGMQADIVIYFAGEASKNATQDSQQNVSDATIQSVNYAAFTNYITRASAANGGAKVMIVPVSRSLCDDADCNNFPTGSSETFDAIQKSQIRAATDHPLGCVASAQTDFLLKEPLELAGNKVHVHNNAKLAAIYYDAIIECDVGLSHRTAGYVTTFKPAAVVPAPPTCGAGTDYTRVGAGSVVLNAEIGAGATGLWTFTKGTVAGQDCASPAAFADATDPDTTVTGTIDGTAGCELRWTCTDGANNTWDEATLDVLTGVTALFGPSTWETALGSGDAALRDTNLVNPWDLDETAGEAEVKVGGDCWDGQCIVFQSDCDGAEMNTPNLQEPAMMTLDVDDVNCLSREFFLAEFEKGWNNLHGEQSFPTVDWYAGSFRHDSTACDNLTTSEGEIPCPTGENGFRNYFSNEVVNVVTGDFWCDLGDDCSNPANHKNAGLVRCSSPLMSHQDVWQRDDIITVLDRPGNRVSIDPKQYRWVAGVHNLVADSDDWDCTFSNNPMNKTLTQHLADGARLPWNDTNKDFYLGNNGPLCSVSAALTDHIHYDNVANYQGACPTP